MDVGILEKAARAVLGAWPFLCRVADVPVINVSAVLLEELFRVFLRVPYVYDVKGGDFYDLEFFGNCSLLSRTVGIAVGVRRVIS